MTTDQEADYDSVSQGLSEGAQNALLHERILVAFGQAHGCPHVSSYHPGWSCGRIEGHDLPHLIGPPGEFQGDA